MMYLSQDGYQLIQAKLDGLTADCSVGLFAKSEDDLKRQVIVIGNRIEDLKKLVNRVVEPDGPGFPA